jgi:rubrerythrin
VKEAGDAWAFRSRVELDAERRFGRLAESIARFDPASPVPALLKKAQLDERRHARLCAELARKFGVDPGSAPPDVAIAPAGLGEREAALYEMVAACCITETESVATVTTLLAQDALPEVRDTLHEIARDEVKHSQMGWAHLAREAQQLDVRFLSPLIPRMLLQPERLEIEPRGLEKYGVLPYSKKREIYEGTLREVVLPGLRQYGIDENPALAWLHSR